MNNFRESLEIGELYDLGHKGDFIMWSNRHNSDTFTKALLDRALANSC